MAADLRERAAELRREILQAVADRQSAVALSLCEKLIEKTPKDTTHASNNWIIAVGEAFQGEDGSRKEPSTSAQDAGFAEIAGYGRNVMRVTQLKPVHVSNNVDYIEALNAGHSQQEPAGFVERASEETLVELEEGAAAGPATRRAVGVALGSREGHVVGPIRGGR